MVGKCAHMMDGFMDHWVFKGARPVTLHGPCAQGARTTQLAQVENFWWGLWADETPPHPLPERWRDYLARLDPMPYEGPPTLQELQDALARWPKGKAPGPDGWRPDDFKR